MSRVALGALGVLAAALVGVLFLELDGLLSEHEVSRPLAQRELPDAPGGQPVLAIDRSRDWAFTILARPLFSATRRPPPGGGASGTAGVGVPRLSGVLVSPSGKHAIFAAPPEGKGFVASEGAQIGGFVLQSISAGQVTLIGPGGTRVLRPSFDTTTSAPSKAETATLAPAAMTPTAATSGLEADQPLLLGLVRNGKLPVVQTTR